MSEPDRGATSAPWNDTPSGDDGTGASLGAARLSAKWSAISIGAAIVCVSVAIAFFVHRDIQSENDLRRQGQVEEIGDSIDRRMNAYTESVVGARALFVVGKPTREEFNVYVAALEENERYPGVQVIGHASLIDGIDLDRYVAQTRDEIDGSSLPLPDFTPYPAGAREEWVVIDYIEPVVGNEAAFGLDFFSEPNRRAAVEFARDTGTAAVTAPITLVQETGSQSGFLVVVPIYDTDLPSESVDQRRAAFQGVSYAAFRMGDLVDGVLADGVADRLTVHDVGSIGGPAESPSSANHTYGEIRAASADWAAEIDIGGRRWLVGLNQSGNDLTQVELVAPFAIGIVGSMIALLSGIAAFVVLDSRSKAIGLAQEMTKDLQFSREELARSNEELERFAYVASHDLQEPLRTIGNFVGLLDASYGDSLDEDGRVYMNFVLDGARRMSVLISELLAYSRADQARNLVPVDLFVTFAEAQSNLRASIEDAGATVICDELPSVMGDRAQLVQVFQNLIGNALKYAGEAPPVVTCTSSDLGDRVMIRVADDGIGIDEQYHDRIFVMLQRLHTRDEIPGTGMGLAIVKKIVEAHGGTVRVESTSGEGSVFVVTLPKIPDRDTDSSTSSTASSRPDGHDDRDLEEVGV